MRAIRMLHAALCGLLAIGFCRAGQPGETLGWVPPEANLIARVDFKSLWRGPLFADYRQAVLRGGAAYSLLQLRMSPRLEDLEEVSAGVWMGPDGMPEFLVALSSASPINMEKAARLFLGNSAVEYDKKAGLWWAGEAGPVMARVEPNTLIFGLEKQVREAIGRKKVPVTPERMLVGQMAVRVSKNSFTDGLGAAIPEEFAALGKASSTSISLDAAGKSLVVSAEMRFSSEEESVAAVKALENARKMGQGAIEQGRQQIRSELKKADKSLAEHGALVFGMGGLNLLEKDLDKVPLVREGKTVSTKLSMDASQVGLMGPMMALGFYGWMAEAQMGLKPPPAQGRLIPVPAEPREMEREPEAPKPVNPREAAVSARSQNNLKQIAIALHNHEAAYGYLPPAAVVDKDGKPLYSWRVLLLPFMEQDALFRKWKLDEPWDSPNNKLLSETVVKVFADPEKPTNKTHYRVFVGEKAGWLNSPRGWSPDQPNWKGLLKFAAFTDGLSNTLAVIETKDAVNWAAPDDLPYDGTKPLPALGMGDRQFANAVFFDGAARRIATNTSELAMRVMIERADGGAPLGVPDSRPKP